MLIRKEKSGKYGVYCQLEGFKRPVRAGRFDTFEEANTFFEEEEKSLTSDSRMGKCIKALKAVKYPAKKRGRKNGVWKRIKSKIKL